MARRISYSDKGKGISSEENPSRGYIKDDVYHIWRCPSFDTELAYVGGKIVYRKPEEGGFSFTSEELAKAMKKSPNPRCALFKFMEKLDYANTERWIEESPPDIKKKRRDWWETDATYGKDTAGETLAIDSMVRVVVNLYKKLTGLDIYETRGDAPYP